MPRVLIDYEDGHYEMRRIDDSQESASWLARHSILITDQEWEEYHTFELDSKYWYERCRTLSNTIYERDKEPSK